MKIRNHWNDCPRFLRDKNFRSLQKVKITLALIDEGYPDEAAVVARVKKTLEAYLPGKVIEVCKGTYQEHFAYWKSLEVGSA